MKRFILVIGLAMAILVLSMAPLSALDEITDRGKKAIVAEAIRDSGYVCPECRLLYYKGESNRGPTFKAYCGYPGESGCRTNLIYKITVTPQGYCIIVPSGMWD